MTGVTKALAAAIGLLLVVSGVGLVTVDDGKPEHVAAGSTTSSTAAPAATTTVPAATPTTAPPDELTTLVHQLQAFVEAHRGLKFSKPLAVTLLDDAKFRARILALAEQDDALLVRTGHELEALGLLRPGVDLRKARDALLGSAVVGFYDPKTEQLVVRGAKLTPYVRSTLAHEITHAVQDQNFHINRPEYDKSEDEISTGFSAVAEGDAVRIQDEYVATLSKRDQQSAAAEEAKIGSGIDMSKIPPVMLQLLAFPYTTGRQFVGALIRGGGQARLDTAFKQPPSTTEQVLHPAKFLAGEGPKQVADPPADAAVVDKGVVGELVLRLMLGTVVSGDETNRAALGWGGDRYVAWDKGSGVCVRGSWVMDSPTDLDELRGALTKWAAQQSNATVSGTDSVILTSCSG